MWTVSAERWMNGLLHPFSGQTCGLSPLWMRSAMPDQYEGGAIG